MAELPPLTEMERLLIMAAAIRGLGPNTTLQYANAGKVVGQALEWAGLIDDAVRASWNQDGQDGLHPSIHKVYGALIRMIPRRKRDGTVILDRPGEPLFEGVGNFGTPDEPMAMPLFCSCRLTADGEAIGQRLLAENPEYRTSANLCSNFCNL